MLPFCLFAASSHRLFAVCLCLSALCLLPNTGRAQPRSTLPIIFVAQNSHKAQAPADVPAAVPPSAANSLTLQMRADDARLNTPVTLDAPRVNLGALLDTLSEQSGVSLTMDVHDPISGLKVFVVCDKTPLGEALDALWSLLSFRDATWKWERSGKAGAYKYQFVQTRAAAGFAQRMKDLAQEAFEKHAANMIAIAALSPEERKTRLSQISATLLQKDDVMAQRMTERDSIGWVGLQAFSQALTPQQQKNVLRGGSASFTLAQLPEELRASFQAQWGQEYHTVNGQQTPVLQPTNFLFERHAGLGIRTLISLMYVTTISTTHSANGSSISTSSRGILGGVMETGLRDKVQNLWMLPGDSRSNALAEKLCEKPAMPISDLPPTPQTEEEYDAAIKQGRQFDSAHAPHKFQHRFGQLAHALPAVIMGVLPSPNDQGYDPGTPYNKVVKKFLDQVARNYESFNYQDMLYKWRGDTLLAIYPTWYLDEESRYPYVLAQQVERASHNGFIPYRDLVSVAARMTPDQWRDLCINTPVLNDMEGAFELLQLCVLYPGLLRENGLTLTDENRETLKAVVNAAENHTLQDSQATAVRCQTVKRVLFGTNRSEIQLQYLDREKKWKELKEYAQKLPK